MYNVPGLLEIEYPVKVCWIIVNGLFQYSVKRLIRFERLRESFLCLDSVSVQR